jgi:SAM-dependent methyltransferase
MDSTDRQRLSAIAHTGSTMWGPISESTIQEILSRAVAFIEPTSGILDLGCGPAELLRRLAERTGASGVGIDASPHAVEEAARRLDASPARHRIELRLVDVHEVPRRPAFDLVICIGPGWDAGGWPELTRWTAGFVRSGGHLLVGEGAWRTKPSDGTLDRLQMSAADYLPSDQVPDAVRTAGVEPQWVHRSTPHEWQAYGDAYRGALRRFADVNPKDPMAAAALQRSGPGWPTFELLHETLDFVLVLGHPLSLTDG